MKKITLFLFVLFLSWQINAQVGIIQNFPTDINPPGWNLGGSNLTSTNSCDTFSWRTNLYGFYTESSLISETQISNGEDLALAFDYKVINYSGPNVATSPYDGTITTQISIDGGATWTVTAGVINAANHTVANTCKNISYVVPGASLPTGSSVKVRWKCNFGTSGDYYVYVDNFSATQPTSTPPFCTLLNSPVDGASNVMNSKITWDNAAGIPTKYKIYVGTDTGVYNLLNGFEVGNINTYDLGALDPSTTYFVKIVPGNTNGFASGCTESSFTTCDALEPEFLEQFNTFLPECWSNVIGGDLVNGPTSSTDSRWVEKEFANNGSSSIKVEVWNIGLNDWIVSPIVQIPAAGYELKLVAAATQWNSTNVPTTPWGEDDFIQILATTSGTSNWTVLHTYNNTNQPSTTGSNLILDLDAYAGQGVRFAFRAVEGVDVSPSDIDFFIDDFQVRLKTTTLPSCTTNLVATPNATCGNFANSITWSAASGADGYKISIGTTPGGTNVVNNLNIGNSLVYSFSGNVNTTYYYSVVPFNSLGVAVGCTQMSFDTVATGCYCPSVPTSVENLGISNIQIGNTNFTNTEVTYFDHSATVVNMTQGINNNVKVTFATGYSYNTHIWIDYNNDFDYNDPGELVYSGESASGNPTVLNASFIMSLSAPLGVHRMRIGTANSGQDIPNPCYSDADGVTLDFAINILPAPSCVPPTALTVSNFNATSANLGWTENGTAAAWDIEFGTLGFVQTEIPTIVGVTNPQLITNLSANTSYSFYVRANCGGGDLSEWSGPYTFTTTCVALDVPYSQDFESSAIYELPSCTSQQNLSLGNLWRTVSSPAGSGFTSKALGYGYSGSNAANVWFFTQGVNLTAGTAYKISYDYGSQGNFYPEKLKVAYGNSPFASAMTNALYDHPNVATTAPVNNVVSFTPTTSGVYYFGFNAYSIANQNYLYIDNILVEVNLSSNSFDNANFLAYPNPVKDVLNLTYSSEISSVRVLNLLGQEVIFKTVNGVSTQVEMSQLTAGAYIVNVKIGDSVKSIKVIKQ